MSNLLFSQRQIERCQQMPGGRDDNAFYQALANGNCFHKLPFLLGGVSPAAKTLAASGGETKTADAEQR